MPYLYAHALHGLSAQAMFDKPLLDITSAHADAFLLGLYGPDVYFGDRLPPPPFAKHQKALANDLHGLDAGVLFRALFALTYRDDRAFAYAVGFLCHFVLDSTLHPYIESRATGSDHTRYEMRMDLLVRNRANDERLNVPPTALYHTDTALRLADTLHTLLFKELFAKNTDGVYRRSYRKWQRVQQLVYDPTGWKLRLLKAYDRLTEHEGRAAGFLLTVDPEDTRDLFNESHDKWCAPWDIASVSTESYFDLFDSAVLDASAIANSAFKERDYGIFDDAIAIIGHRCMNGTTSFSG